ncbi:CHAP domain-containing protein [Actinoallomurus purpureus]|uniref:CHAP domain-containing protein n=1 Tax=Actinoallomurus purpureus TaxID=478114 RepID=UPI0020934952|nr:CHAP domain-containing protein [Actinoallomurus purpureus]MCO6006878.1 CHAP domain-containing protein [Actinoallomurus purpureus]
MSPVSRYPVIPFRGRAVSAPAAVMTGGAAAIILIAAVLLGLGRHKPPTAADALKVALSQVGATENAAGGTKFNRWFMSSPYARIGVERDGGSISDYANANWCDMFVSWVGVQAGVKGIGGDAFTPTHAEWFRRQGRWGSVPRPGAVVFFSWNGGGIDHVGLVVKDNHNGTVETVEGNTDNAVRIRTRSTDYVVGYGYPKYRR